MVSAAFTCFASKWKYEIKRILKCDSSNIINLITNKFCKKQYVVSASSKVYFFTLIYKSNKCY